MRVVHLRRPVRRGGVLGEIRLRREALRRRPQARLPDRGAAEIAQLPRAVRTQQEVLGLDVAVAHGRRRRVHRRHRASGGGEDGQSLGFGHADAAAAVRVRFLSAVHQSLPFLSPLHRLLDVRHEALLAELHHEEDLDRGRAGGGDDARRVETEELHDVGVVGELLVRLRLLARRGELGVRGGTRLERVVVHGEEGLLERDGGARADVGGAVHARVAALGEHRAHADGPILDRHRRAGEVAAGRARRRGGGARGRAGGVFDRVPDAGEGLAEEAHRAGETDPGATTDAFQKAPGGPGAAGEETDAGGCPGGGEPREPRGSGRETGRVARGADSRASRVSRAPPRRVASTTEGRRVLRGSVARWAR